MSLYLSWGIVPYLVWLGMWLVFLVAGTMVLNLLLKENKFERQVSKVAAVAAFVFLAQFPWHHDSTHSQNYRLHFNKGVEYNGQQIERDKPRESWQERSEKLRSEARKAADEVTERAIRESKKGE